MYSYLYLAYYSPYQRNLKQQALKNLRQKEAWHPHSNRKNFQSGIKDMLENRRTRRYK